MLFFSGITYKEGQIMSNKIKLSVGIENADDIIEDIDNALNA